MQDLPKKAQLKDKTTVMLRLMTKDDLDKIIEFYKVLPEEDKLFLREDVTKRETIEKWIRGINYDKVLPLLAEKDKRLVGHATLHMPEYGWSRHIGEIRVVVARDFQRKGLGSLMAAKTFNIALSKGLDKLIARMMDTQISARKGFEKLGFKEECRLKDHVMDLNGKKHDMIIMSSSVADLWKRMEDLIVYSEMRVIG